MDTRYFDTKVELSITPIYHDEPPLIKVIGFDQPWNSYLEQPQVFTFNQRCRAGLYTFEIQLLNKKDSDTIADQGLDKAVTIDWIAINGIRDQKFIWKGQYSPEYPEPWYGQQDPKPPKVMSGHTYLGWNGRWTLDVTVPAFVWVHQTLDLGWIYD